MLTNAESCGLTPAILRLTSAVCPFERVRSRGISRPALSPSRKSRVVGCERMVKPEAVALAGADKRLSLSSLLDEQADRSNSNAAKVAMGAASNRKRVCETKGDVRKWKKGICFFIIVISDLGSAAIIAGK